MKKILSTVGVLLAILLTVYFAGPKPKAPQLLPKLPVVDVTPSDFEAYLMQKEAGLNIKPDNESRVLWANDSLKAKTPYCLLYLHGYSASWYEGEPVHRDFARRYGMNLFIPLLASHGIATTEALIDMTPDRLYDSAKEALVAAHVLGDKVLIMSTSTGGTLSLKLAADFPELIDGLLLLSPNVAINDPQASMVTKPWGLQLARFVKEGKYRIYTPKYDEELLYWQCKQRLESAVYLQQLVETTMKKETFVQITDPVFLAYYYKNEKEQDDVVKVEAMFEMFDQLGTPESLKQKVAFPEAGTHVIGSKLLSNAWKNVEEACNTFAEETLGLLPVQQQAK